MITVDGNKIIYRYDAEQMWVEPHGINAVRIRSTKCNEMPCEDWALGDKTEVEYTIDTYEDRVVLRNGKINATVYKSGKLIIENQHGKKVIEEYIRNRRDVTSNDCSALDIDAREFKPNINGDYKLTYRLTSLDKNEKIYGMGQYQQSLLNIKGTDIELAHRNSQASVPFYISSLGYGFLWNNPAVGRAVFGNNIMSFEANSTKKLDVWIVVDDTPKEIERLYSEVVGKVPMMPEYGLGFWQCKLRYQTQEELLEVAREYKRRGLPIDVIVIDFFHWYKQGDWKFDKTYWPNPKQMVDELKQMGIELMVSIWPTVDSQSENFDEMLENGYLIRVERGVRVGLNFQSSTIHYDATNPGARKYLWDKIKQNYYDLGIKLFWLDEAEPEYSAYDFENYRYHLGTNSEIGNVYPKDYAKTFFEGMQEEGQKNIVNLVRCAWVGSQKYGALVWSGDIASSFWSMKNQLSAGLSMGIAGIPWWTTDIGGFHGGNIYDKDFHELLIRWFQFGTYCPVMRLHGDREPHKEPMGTEGGATCVSGADNEVWSYGEEVYNICKKYLNIRENLRDYTRNIMKQAHELGDPVMRTMFYEFPEDSQCWDIEDQYMYGDMYLVAPILELGARSRKIYLPKDVSWEDVNDGKVYTGGQWIELPAPIEIMPVLKKVL